MKTTLILIAIIFNLLIIDKCWSQESDGISVQLNSYSTVYSELDSPVFEVSISNNTDMDCLVGLEEFNATVKYINADDFSVYNSDPAKVDWEVPYYAIKVRKRETYMIQYVELNAGRYDRSLRAICFRPGKYIVQLTIPVKRGEDISFINASTLVYITPASEEDWSAAREQAEIIRMLLDTSTPFAYAKILEDKLTPSCNYKGLLLRYAITCLAGISEMKQEKSYLKSLVKIFSDTGYMPGLAVANRLIQIRKKSYGKYDLDEN